jgi:hypothetical protein
LLGLIQNRQLDEARVVVSELDLELPLTPLMSLFPKQPRSKSSRFPHPLSQRTTHSRHRLWAMRLVVLTVKAVCLFPGEKSISFRWKHSPFQSHPLPHRPWGIALLTFYGIYPSQNKTGIGCLSKSLWSHIRICSRRDLKSGFHFGTGICWCTVRLAIPPELECPICLPNNQTTPCTISPSKNSSWN